MPLYLIKIQMKQGVCLSNQALLTCVKPWVLSLEAHKRNEREAALV